MMTKRRRSIGHFLTWDNVAVDEDKAAAVAELIEGLTSKEKKCLTICCYLGLSFTYKAAKGLGGMMLSRKDKETGLPVINGVLASLVEKNILSVDQNGHEETMGSDGTAAEYCFVDSKLAVVLYKGTEMSKRTFQHQKVALWIEETFTDDLRTHFAPLMYHFMRAQVWDKTSKYMKLSIQTAVLAGAMLEATVVVDQALLNEALPCETLIGLETQLRDCRETCERAESVAVANEAADGASTQTPLHNTAVGGMQKSWFDFANAHKDLTLTEIVQNQVKHMDKLLLVNESGEGYTAEADATPSMAVKVTILKAGEARVKLRVQEARKAEGLRAEASAPAPAPSTDSPETPGGVGDVEKAKGGMFGRLFKKRKVAPSS